MPVYMLHPLMEGTVLRKGGKWFQIEPLTLGDLMPRPGGGKGGTTITITMHLKRNPRFYADLDTLITKPVDVTIEYVLDKPRGGEEVFFALVLLGAVLETIWNRSDGDGLISNYTFRYDKPKYPMGKLVP